MAEAPKSKRRNRDSGKAGVEPSTRTFTRWSPERLRVAEMQADAGNIRVAADLVDWILADDRVQGTLQARIQALLGLEPSFEQSGDRRRSNRAVKALDAQEDWWASYPEPELSLMLAWGIVLGLAPMQHQWRAVDGHGGRRLPCPEFWHPHHLRHDSATRSWKVRVATETGFGSTEETLTPGDGQWVLHTPYGAHRPQMLGAWRGLSRWVLLKYLAAGDLASASAKGSTLVATSEAPGTTPKDGSRDTYKRNNADARSQLATDIYERGRDGVVVLPPNFDLKLIQTAANTESIYVAQINLANEAIAIQIRGGNLTTNTKQGSLAAAETQERLGDAVKLQFDGSSLSTTIHDQSLVWWAEFNFGDRELAPWPVYPTKPKRNHLDRAKAITQATDAAEALLSLGLEIEAQAFIDEWELAGWVKPSPSSKLLIRPAPNPFGAPPGEKPLEDRQEQ